ncbi:hypothetical protein [Alkaliphilus sp. B6464]|uniref:hypothetical protein n=1 Tax=Alkaliphilus sp. B6464 TaxID=2731219 RepID=UPI001BA7B815|nr:hypothetical protein [Alkaliphilus sp. B6464]QUH21417.1 hypothetical protein HYG84_17030 [Alkaliphilus sp. B6464]
MKVLTTKPNLVFIPKEEKDFKRDLEKEMGKGKQVPNLGLSYIQGIKAIDENRKNSNPASLEPFIYAHDGGVSFKLMSAISKEAWYIGISKDYVHKVYFIDGDVITKSKSVIKRGIAGTLIAGPVGTIIGGMSGIGEIAEQEAYMVMETDENKIFFKCRAGTKDIFEMKFKNIFGDKAITSEEIKRQQEQELLNNI